MSKIFRLSFFATLKTELGSNFADCEHAQLAVADYIDFYNYDRMHSTIGYVSPALAELNPKHAVHAA